MGIVDISLGRIAEMLRRHEHCGVFARAVVVRHMKGRINPSQIVVQRAVARRVTSAFEIGD
jgi:hypothetical protein